tara:strand:- start:538 stop:3708 length:3171 start_codon:yes stop_codon:yes gene_type:complete
MRNGLDILPQIQKNSRSNQEEMEDPTFAETVGATLSYRYRPAIDYIRELKNFGFAPPLEDGFNPMDMIDERNKEFAPYLMRAASPEQFKHIESGLIANKASRNIIDRASTGQNIAAGVLDPVNVVPIPFVKGANLYYRMFKQGAYTAGLVGGQEAIRYPLDPLSTPDEPIVAIGSSFIIGGALRGLIDIPLARRVNATRAAEKEIKELTNAVEADSPPLDDLTQGPAKTDLNIAKNFFTDSWFFKAIPTAAKRILQDDKLPDETKETLLKIQNDSGILLEANKRGAALDPSVAQDAKLLEGEFVQHYDELLQIWGKYTGKGVVAPFDYMGFKRKPFEAWTEMVSNKRIKGEAPANEYESQAMKVFSKYFDDLWEPRLREEGMIGHTSYYRTNIRKRKANIKMLEGKIKKSKNKDYINTLSSLIAKNKEVIKGHEEVLEEYANLGKMKHKNEVAFFPRYFDTDEIRSDRNGFEKDIREWISENPASVEYLDNGEIVKIDFSTDPADVAKRVTRLTDRILNEHDPLDVDQMFFGLGKSKHQRHRILDIPNALVLKYIHTNPIQVMRAYTSRVGARYEFSRQFGGKQIDEVLMEQDAVMAEAKIPLKRRNAALKDIQHAYDRVVGTTKYKSPSSWDYTIAQVLRDAAQFGYLGGAGVATLTEPAKIVMEHGFKETFQGLFTMLQQNQLKMGAKELRIAGEALELLLGSVHLRLVDDLSNNPLRSTIFDKAKNGFYALNGLGPFTRIFKDFDGMMRSHTIIDYSKKWANGSANKMEREFLARYTIDENMAKRITAQEAIQQGDSGLYLANTEKWTDAEATRRFRVALGSGAANTILMGTPMDKPNIVDGVAYIPMSVASKLGMKESTKYRGYARIENALMGLPFQFYSYSLAAVNKTMGAYASGQVKSQYMGTAMALGLGYMVLQIRTPDYIELKFQDQFARAFDYSGLMPLHTDMFYTAMATSLAMGGPNITGGFVAPKFPQGPNAADALTGIGGAGPSIALDYYRAFADLITGNYNEGVKDLARILPFAQIFWYKDFVNSMLGAIREELPQKPLGRFN